MQGRTTGVLGHRWRATVTPWGDVHPWNGSPALTWAIAADDRWHFPEGEPSVRQTLVSGTPVFETRVRVPNGDVVQHVWSASSTDGVSAILMEFANDSSMPLAVSLSRGDVVTPRTFHRLGETQRPWPSADRGIDRPEVVIPLGHRSRMRIALPMTGNPMTANMSDEVVDSFPDWQAVARGWTTVTDRASVIEIGELVDGRPLMETIRDLRTTIALDVPDVTDHSTDTAVRWIAAHRELVRMGMVQTDVPELVSTMELLLRRVRKSKRVDAFVAGALLDGAEVLGCSDARAFGDFERATLRSLRRIGLVERGEADIVHALRQCLRVSLSDVDGPRGVDVMSIGRFESEIVRWSATDEATLLPDGFRSERLGMGFEAFRLPAGPQRAVSLAIRWHGERPAVIWEVNGPPGLLLRSGVDPNWSSVEAAGEALWSLPSENWIAR